MENILLQREKQARLKYAIGEELDAKIYSPAPVKGTRWVPHVDRALQVFLQGKKDGDLATNYGYYAAVCMHMKSLASSSKNTDVKSRAAKLYKLMTTRKFVQFAHFMVDLFGVVPSLSLNYRQRHLSFPLPFRPLRHASAPSCP